MHHHCPICCEVGLVILLDVSAKISRKGIQEGLISSICCTLTRLYIFFILSPVSLRFCERHNCDEVRAHNAL